MDNQFIKKARYRCEQINISRINEETITLSSSVNNQYLYSQARSNPQLIKTDWEDYHFQIEPGYLESGMIFANKIADLRKELVIAHDGNGSILTIANMPTLKNRWQTFREQQLPEDELFQSLKEKAPTQAAHIISTGDLEFSDEKTASATLEKDLFFHILLRAIAEEKAACYRLALPSQLFPELILYIDVEQSELKSEEGLSTWILTGKLDKALLPENKLRQQYEEFYRPMIKYNYTEFDYLYKITYTIDDINLLVKAKASLHEKIRNNIEAITEYTIRQVEL